MSEWAGLRAVKITNNKFFWLNGWSARNGLTKNPYNLNADTWGSSSGSAVAVATNLVTVALGTETGGSIILPASSNGVVGLKPTTGLIGRGGVIPISQSFDSVGVLANHVSDVAIVLSVLAGNDDTRDKINQHVPSNKFHKNYTLFLKNKNLKGVRIGILDTMQTGILAKMILPQKVINAITKAGGTVVRIKLTKNDLKLLKKADQITLDEYEFKDGINTYLKTRVKTTNSRYKHWPMMHNLQDIINFNNTHKRIENMALLGQQLLLASQAKGSIHSKAYRILLKNTQGGSRKFINTIFKEHNLDLFIGAFIDKDLSDPAAAAGYPRITIPLTVNKNHIPISVELTALAYDEPLLLRTAAILEKAIHYNKTPQYYP